MAGRPVEASRQARVLEAYARTGSITAAALEAGVDRATARKIVRRSGLEVRSVVRLGGGDGLVSPGAVSESPPDAATLPPIVLEMLSERSAKWAESKEASQPVVEAASDELESVLPVLRKSPLTLAEIATRGKVSQDTALAWIEAQKSRGVNIQCFGGSYSIETTFQSSHDLGVLHEYVSRPDNTFLFGACGDQHLCFPPQTPITTDRGEVRIASVKPGDMVLTHKNRFRPVAEVIATPGDGRLVRVWFTAPRKDGRKRSGKAEKACLVCTPNHPVLVVRDGADGWIPAGEIRPGDAVRGTGKPCKHCETLVPEWMTVCHEHDPYVRDLNRTAKANQRREQAYRSSGAEHYNRDILPEMEKWQQEGWRVVPIERVRPDFIAFRDGKIVAVEVESPLRYRPNPVYEKYDFGGQRSYYDEVVWVEKDPRTKTRNRVYDWLPANEHGFLAFVVSSVEEFRSKPTKVYNLKVEEDESYVAKRCVVHNCSKYERLDVLERIYDRYASAGVDRVFNTGNWIDGEARFNKYDLKVHGMAGQLAYLAEHYPRRPGIHTYAVAGDDHEGWYGQREGVDIGRYAEHAMRDAGRDDWHDLGYMEAHVKLINANTGATAMLAVVHPGGGSAYALSYSIQKIVESYDGGEKPAVGLYGHYHKLWAGNIRNVWTCQTGTAQDQTPFMRKKRLEAHVGAFLVGLTQDPETGAIVEMTPTMLRYFNRGFYNNRWSHAKDVMLPMRT